MTTPPTKLEGRPKYRIIQDLIRQGIADNSLPDNNKLPSEHDMARRFGVAYMTVRAAVNEMVGDGTLRRIHGKGTFVAAPPIPSTAIGTLALVVPSLPSLWNVAGLYYFPSIVQGFCAEATRLGYEPTVIGRTTNAAASASGGFKGRGVAPGEAFAGIAGAACLLVSREDTPFIEALRDERVPVVGINAYNGRRTISFVAVDQAGGMAEAVAMLAAQGHRRVAFLPGPAGNIGAEERQKGFVRAAQEHDLETVVESAEPCDYTDLSGAIRTERLLGRSSPANRPTAIVSAGDLIAAGALQAIRAAGLSVPGDISVVGYGDFHLASHLQPALSTVRLPLASLGARAAALLHRHIGGTGGRQTVLLETQLIARDSVSPPPAREEA